MRSAWALADPSTLATRFVLRKTGESRARILAWEQVLSALQDAGVPGPVQVDDFRRIRAYGGPTGEWSCYRPLASSLRAIGAVLNPIMFCMPELADPGVVHPDIVLRSSERTIIVDTKFYKKPIDTRFGGERVRSANLYQIFAYVTNWAAAASADGRGPAGGGTRQLLPWRTPLQGSTGDS